MSEHEEHPSTQYIFESHSAYIEIIAGKREVKKLRTHHTQYFGVEKNVRIRPRN